MQTVQNADFSIIRGMGALPGVKSVLCFLLAAALVLGLRVAPGFAEEEPLGIWRGSVDLSLITATGNSNAQTGSMKAETSKRTERDRWVARAGGLFAKSEGEKTAESYYANGEYNFFHSAKTYSKYFLAWERDKLAGLNTRLTAGAGLGHECIKTEKDLLVSEAMVAYVYENGEEEDQSFPEGRLFSRYDHRFREGVTFFQELEWLQDLTLLTNYRINSITGLKMAINKSWAVKTSVTIHYDHQPAEGFRKTDTITETALVYRF